MAADDRLNSAGDRVASPPADRIAALIERHGADPTALIEVLHRVQLLEGHLSPASLYRVAQGLRLPLSQVQGVASFYHLFRRSPAPQHRCAVCFGTACFVNGAPQLLEAVRTRMAEETMAAAGADPAAGGASGSWRLQRSGCLAACGHGPVLRIDDGPALRIPLTPDLQDRLDGLGLPPAVGAAPG